MKWNPTCTNEITSLRTPFTLNYDTILHPVKRSFKCITHFTSLWCNFPTNNLLILPNSSIFLEMNIRPSYRSVASYCNIFFRVKISHFGKEFADKLILQRLSHNQHFWYYFFLSKPIYKLSRLFPGISILNSNLNMSSQLIFAYYHNLMFSKRNFVSK